MQLQNGTLKSRGEVPQEAKCFLRKGKAISDETGKDEKKTIRGETSVTTSAVSSWLAANHMIAHSNRISTQTAGDTPFP